MQSPQDGRIKIRISYDWERLEAPTVMTSLNDRPNDGGGGLHAVEKALRHRRRGVRRARAAQRSELRGAIAREGAACG